MPSQLTLISIASEYTTPKNWWENQLRLAYGIQRIDKEQVRKTDQKIIFLTRYSYMAKPYSTGNESNSFGNIDSRLYLG